MKKEVKRKIIILVSVLLVASVAGASFVVSRRNVDHVYPADTLVKVGKLSDYEPSLKGTISDSNVFFFDSGVEGDTLFVAGGTHPNESAAILSAVLLIENLELTQGRVIVLPAANASALANTLPGYGYPDSYGIDTPTGERRFTVGNRCASPLDQWPDPPVFVQYPSGQNLCYEDARNLNRNYPGRSNGTLTERVGNAIMNLIKSESVDYAFDLHEASITYPTNDVMVVPEKTSEIAMLASMFMAERGIPIHVEISVGSLNGYTHREWGKIEGCHACLIEAPTPFIERIPGVMNEALITEGKDEFLARVASWGFAAVPYDENGYSIEWRCGLHLTAIAEMLRCGGAAIEFSWPEFEELEENGVGAYLSEVGRSYPMY